MGLAGDRFGLARSFALVPLSYLIMVALVLAAAPARRGRSGSNGMVRLAGIEPTTFSSGG